MKRAGVIGWPVAHSLSPVLHGYWLKQYGIAGTYEKIPATPEEFPSVIARLRDEGYAGVNVTVPHKEAAFALADSNDEVAKSAGATNLLTFTAHGVEGRNTDAYGLMASLQENIGRLDGGDAILLGAGGAARGAIIALLMLGVLRIDVLVRNENRRDAFMQSLLAQNGIRFDFDGAYRLTVSVMDNFPQAAADARLVVNATSAGMGSNPPLDLDLSALPKDAAICDIVYHPLETQLLKDAKARGLKTIDGLGMLMHQAVPSFEAFFGTRPQVTPGLRAALERELQSRG